MFPVDLVFPSSQKRLPGVADFCGGIAHGAGLEAERRAWEGQGGGGGAWRPEMVIREGAEGGRASQPTGCVWSKGFFLFLLSDGACLKTHLPRSRLGIRGAWRRMVCPRLSQGPLWGLLPPSCLAALSSANCLSTKLFGLIWCPSVWFVYITVSHPEALSHWSVCVDARETSCVQGL